MRADLLFTYKLVFGLIDASLHDFRTTLQRVRRGHDYKLYLPTCKTNIRPIIVSTTESYRNGTHFQIALILHHLKDFINLWPLKCYFHIARYFYLVGCVAYRQYVFCI